jgi:hypothetical protein
MSFSRKLLGGAIVVVVAVLATTLVWVRFPTEGAFACALVAPPVSLSVLLYLALNRSARLKRYRYVGFFLPVMCVLTWVIVIFVLHRAEGRGDPDGGEDILEGLSVIYVIELGIAFVCLRYIPWRTVFRRS